MIFADIDHVLIFFSIFLCLYLGIRRSLSITSTLGAFFAACLFVLLDLHYTIGEITLGNGENPQIATVALMFLSVGLLIAAVIPKSRRSLDRVMVLTASLSVIATFSLFHYVLVQQVMPAWAKDAAWGNSYLLPVDRSGFEEACKQSLLVCWTGTDIERAALPDAYAQQIYGLNRFYLENPSDDEIGHGFGVFNDLGSNGVAAVLYHKKGDDIRVIVDSPAGVKIHSTIRDSFYLLSTVAHSVWLGGALFLIAFHRKRFKRRSA